MGLTYLFEVDTAKPWSRVFRKAAPVGPNREALSWTISSARKRKLPRSAAAVLTALGTRCRPGTWDKFSLCIEKICKLVGYSRSTVNAAIARLKAENLIAYDGQIPVGEQRPVAVYRVTGPPDCPLPEATMDLREEEWRRSRETAPEWEPADDVFPGQEGNRTKNQTTGGSTYPKEGVTFGPQKVLSDSSGTEGFDCLPSKKNEVQPFYPSSKTTKTEPKGEPDFVVPLGEYVTSGGVKRRRWEPRRRKQTRFLLAQKRAEEVLARFGSYWNLPLPQHLRDMLLPEVESPSVGAEDRGNVIPPRSFTAEGAVMNPFTDPALGALPRDVRLLFLGLERLFHSDPHVSTDPRFLKGEIFRYDDDITPEIIADMLALIEEAEVAFSAPQAPQDALFGIPVPSAPGRSSSALLGTKEALFEQLWLTWPKGRRINKGGSRKKFMAACNKAHPQLILAAAIAQTNNWIEIDKEVQFIPHLTTWLEGERWGDELEAAPEVRSRVQDAARQNAALIEFYRSQEAQAALDAPTGPKAISW